MRILALDYGSAHIGCAVSDPTGTLSSPVDSIVVSADDGGVESIRTAVIRHGAESVVVGMPVNLAGRIGEQARATKVFVDRLVASLDIPVETFDERFTSRMARRTAREVRTGGARPEADEHSIAAAHLLDTYLEYSARNGSRE